MMQGGAHQIAREAARALDDHQQHGVMHRDIKPENLLLTAPPDPAAIVSAWTCRPR